MDFLPGVPPTLEAMLRAGYVRVDKKPKKETSHGEDSAAHR
jgi:hypothetical protein